MRHLYFSTTLRFAVLLLPFGAGCADILGFQDAKEFPETGIDVPGDGSPQAQTDGKHGDVILADPGPSEAGDAAPVGADVGPNTDAGADLDARRPTDPDGEAGALVDAEGGPAVDACAPVCCGNGTVDPGEECDDGATLNTGAYGKCNPNCTRGPFCGDGKINGPDEACDNGIDNSLALGACNPACTGFVRQKNLKIDMTFPVGYGGALTGDWDAACRGGAGPSYLGLVVDGTTRIASRTPFKGDGQLNWVLKPYTRYVNEVGDLVWTTDNISLFGVRNGNPAPLINPIAPSGSIFGWVGVNDDWTTSSSNCNVWTESTAAASGNGFRLTDTTLHAMLATCDTNGRIICVEQ